MSQNKVSVVIPVYNEEKNILTCMDKLCTYMSESFEDYEITLEHLDGLEPEVLDGV